MVLLPRFSSPILLLLILLFASTGHVFGEKKSYIVFLGEHSHGPEITEQDIERVTNSHHEFLASFLGSKEKVKEAIFYSYTKHINGFAATLEEGHAESIAGHPDVLLVTPNKRIKLHTTHSWDFLSLENNGGAIHSNSLWKKANFGEDIIIATMDTGVWPESKSFSDENYGPIPSRWKGACEDTEGPNGVRCNKKLIGAKKYLKGYLAENSSTIFPGTDKVRDIDGHGTHTLSTAAGNFVPGADYFGFQVGTTKGGSPRARVAAYKVCWGDYCSNADIVQGIDEAIHDGVDVISMSLGGDPEDYSVDVLAIATFHAVKKNIVVVCSAGNSGPKVQTAENTAPWIITVGASTLDRKYESGLKLHNGLQLKGASLSRSLPKKSMYPLIYGKDAKAANVTWAHDAEWCDEGTLDPEKVKGKIVVCLDWGGSELSKGKAAYDARAAGMVLCAADPSDSELFADPHYLPAVYISYNDSLRLYHYMNSTKHHSGYILPTRAKYGVKPAPVVAPFSSRGPNIITPYIIKPDVIAPGVDVFASYSPFANRNEDDYRHTSFEFLSGTSMSCPHVSGVIGLLKKLHPDWSPAALRSAIMTTAQSRDNNNNPIQGENKPATPYDIGSGHITPNQAADPGLVYDLTMEDHLNLLCAIGYNKKKIRLFSDKPYKCPKKASITSYNYPSISVPIEYGSVTVTRKLKNVGTPGSYVAHVRHIDGVKFSVEPETLTFKKIGEEKSFKLRVEITTGDLLHAKFGELLWTDGEHYVRSPLVIGHKVIVH